MPTYEFRIVLAAADQVVDDLTHAKFVEMSNSLYEAGCDDGSPETSGGIVSIEFHREAGSLREAIESAVANVKSAGYRVAGLESNGQIVYDAINERLIS